MALEVMNALNGLRGAPPICCCCCRVQVASVAFLAIWTYYAVYTASLGDITTRTVEEADAGGYDLSYKVSLGPYPHLAIAPGTSEAVFALFNIIAVSRARSERSTCAGTFGVDNPALLCFRR